MPSHYYSTPDLAQILPRLRQYESTTGRTLSPSIIRALLSESLSVGASKSLQASEIGLQRQRIRAEERAASGAARGQTASGIAQTATSATTLGLLYKGGFFKAPPTTGVTDTVLPAAPIAKTTTTGAVVNAPGVAGTASPVAGPSALSTIGYSAIPAVAGFGVGYGVGGATKDRIGTGPSRVASAGAGAVTGAAIGSVVPGVGTAIGAVVGGAAGYFGGVEGGKK
jgi:hypothetical protein